MSTVKQGDTVKVHYVGKFKDGQVFDTSKDREPLEFTIGSGQVIKGFEDAVDGMTQGESKVVDVPAGDAYGDVRPDLVIQVPKSQIPPDLNVEAGQQLQMQTKDGQQIPVVVVETTEEKVVIDANHPMAGKDLTFEIELLEVQ